MLLSLRVPTSYDVTHRANPSLISPAFYGYPFIFYIHCIQLERWSPFLYSSQNQEFLLFAYFLSQKNKLQIQNYSTELPSEIL